MRTGLGAGSSGCGGGEGGFGGGGTALGAGGAAGSAAMVVVAASAVASSLHFFDMQELMSGTGTVTLVCAMVVVVGSVVSVRAKTNNDN